MPWCTYYSYLLQYVQSINVQILGHLDCFHILSYGGKWCKLQTERISVKEDSKGPYHISTSHRGPFLRLYSYSDIKYLVQGVFLECIGLLISISDQDNKENMIYKPYRLSWQSFKPWHLFWKSCRLIKLLHSEIPEPCDIKLQIV